MKEEDRRTEKASAEAVAEVLGGRLIWRDTPGSTATTHDYDIVLADGRVVAAEVTAVTIPTDKALESELERNFRAPLPGLRHRWWVSVNGRLSQEKPPRAYADELRFRLEQTLAALRCGTTLACRTRRP